MRISLLSMVVTAAIATLCACKSSDVGSSPNSDAATNAVPVGKYRAIFLPPAEGEAASMSVPSIEELVGVVPPRLEIKSGNTYLLLVMGMPVEGNVVRSNGKVELVPRTIVGIPVAELDKTLELKLGGEKMVGKVGQDGRSFVVTLPEYENIRVEFQHFVPKPYTPNAVAISTEKEKAILGDFRGRALLSSAKEKSKEQLLGEKVAIGLGGNATLSLYEDGRFAIALVMEMAGKWKLENNKLTLYPDTVNGETTEAALQRPEKPLVFTVDFDKSILQLDNLGPGDAKLQFVREDASRNASESSE